MNNVVPDATAQVLAENQFNDPPASGHQFFMINVTFEYDGTGSENATLVEGNLKAVGAAGVGYTQGSHDSCGVTPDDLGLKVIGVDVFSGGNVSGNVCFSVLSSDAASLKLYVDVGGQRYWYALH